MKIPSNPTGPGGIPPESAGGNIHTGRSQKNPSAEGAFQALTPRSGSSHAAGATRIAVRPEWRRAVLDEPEQLQSMLRESVQSLVSSSPLASSFSTQQLAELERVLSGDPVMRELITQHLEQSLS